MSFSTSEIENEFSLLSVNSWEETAWRLAVKRSVRLYKIKKRRQRKAHPSAPNCYICKKETGRSGNKSYNGRPVKYCGNKCRAKAQYLKRKKARKQKANWPRKESI